MAFFGRNKTEKSAKATEPKKGDLLKEKKDAEKEIVDETKKDTQVSKALSTDRNLSSVLSKPRITEKAVKMGEKNVYAFVVRRDATKYDVRDAVISLFNVTPVKVNIVNRSPRRYVSQAKGRTVAQKGMKKAYVYLKAGDSIELA